CAVPCAGACTGACEGACEAACAGACEGACEAACAGACEDACDDACEGASGCAGVCAVKCAGGSPISARALAPPSFGSLATAVRAETETVCERPVARSRALTLTMPLRSIANVTSICGTPAACALIPSRSKRPSESLVRAVSDSPCTTCTSTLV